MDEDRRAARRYRASGTVRGRQPATPFSAEIADISRSGCKLVATSRPIPVGSTLLLDLADTISTAGQAIWSDGRSLGVRFLKELPEARVEEFASRDFIVASGEWIAE